MQHSRRDPQPPDAADPTPSDPLGNVTGLLDDIVVINSVSAALLRHVEALIGLRIGELQALLAISEGADHPRTVASNTGQITAAATATVEALVERSLVGRHHHPAAPAGSDPTLLHLTGRGTAAVQQAEGIQIRALGTLATALGHRCTSDLRAGVRALAIAM